MLPPYSSFVALDALRRSRGILQDALGSGPREQPWEQAAAFPGAVLRQYGGREGGPPLMIVPAPFKRPYIWDLMPAVSVVRAALDRGFRVFLLEWATPEEGARDRGLADFALRLPEAAATEALRLTGSARLVLAGHSLGGTMAAIFAARRPEAVAGLVLADAPLAFGEVGGPLADAVRAGPPAREVAAAFGATVPGSAINLFSVQASPDAFVRQPMEDWIACANSPERLAIHLRVSRWALDEFPMPARLFEDIAELLYRSDRFRRGGLDLGGDVARLADLAAPLAVVVNRVGLVVPPGSVLAGLREAPAERLVLRYRPEPGPSIQHLGPLVAPGAHVRLWPRLLDWVRAAAERGG